MAATCPPWPPLRQPVCPPCPTPAMKANPTSSASRQDPHRRHTHHGSEDLQPSARRDPPPNRTRQRPTEDAIHGTPPGQPLPVAHRRRHRRRPRTVPPRERRTV